MCYSTSILLDSLYLAHSHRATPYPRCSVCLYTTRGRTRNAALTCVIYMFISVSIAVVSRSYYHRRQVAIDIQKLIICNY
jgi:hypothetical protein